jgi:hypothetical protein
MLLTFLREIERETAMPSTNIGDALGVTQTEHQSGAGS